MMAGKRLGLGLAALGRPGYINLGHGQDLGTHHDVEAMRQNAHSVLDAARAGGVVYYDAARSYGRAEEFLGGWLRSRGIQPGELTIASKWGYTYTAGWRIDADKHEVKDHSLAVLRRQTDETRGLLGGYLNVYQIHSASLESGVLDRQDVLEELARLRDAGWMIGLSLTGPAQADTLAKAMTVNAGGKPLFRSVQATWNLLERSCGEMLGQAHAAGWRVVVKEGLANGRLTGRHDDPNFSIQRGMLEQAAERLHCSIDALALAGILAQPWADVVLSGATTVEQLQSNLQAANVAWDDACDRELAGIVEPPREYWQTRAALAWN